MACLLFAPGELLKMVAAAEDDNVIESFEVEGNGDLLLIPVTVGGKVHQFVVDTGCSTTVFHTSLKSTLKPTGSKAALTQSRKRVDLFECPEGVVGQSQMPLGKWAVCMDLSEARRDSSHYEIDGVLGMDFLKSRILQIDFDAGRLRFLKSGTGAPGQKVEMQFDRLGRPTVPARIADLDEAQFLVDTANTQFNDGSLTKEIFDRLVQLKSISAVHTRGAYEIDGGSSDHRQGTVSTFSVAGFKHEGQMLDDSGGESGSLSLGHLSRFTATFDFPNRALFLAKGKQFDRKFPMNVLGATAYPVHRGLYVMGLDPEGLGARCGLEYAHMILEIDGRSTIGMTLYASRLLLFDPAEGTRLKIRASALRPPFEIKLTKGTPSPPAPPTEAERREFLRTFLKKIVEDNPDSEAAQEAARLLDKE